ncbi:carbohydrate ABC transporter permease [Marasmitruncus massiliensis]|uniref:carbohydrate ABC transporter permease n=1 Tax=Marasmitruncus massiliensis TaxID=1944642 RepID=UPI000C7AAAFD|nr:sugar ABC transporter permease [Marasmitruncus massiliensis]
MKTLSPGTAGRAAALPRGQQKKTPIDRELRRKWKTTLLAWGVLLPSLLFLGTFTIYPILSSLIKSFYKDDLATVIPRFIGLQNYTGLLNDPIFAKSFFNNLLVAVCTVPTSIALAVAMAVFTNKVIAGKGIVRTAFFYPTILPMVAVANIWLFIYTPIYGLASYLNPAWRILGNPDTAIWGLIVMLNWKQAGYLMIFYLSGLQGIPSELYEAAMIDGSGPLQTFRNITWPMLQPTTLYITIIALTNAYKTVDHLYIMTKGGPNNSTNMLLFYIYQVGFDFWDTGKASAMTIVLIVLLLTATCVYFFTQDKKTFYN